MEKIYNILASFLGESKNGFDIDSTQYQFNCICCAEQNGVSSDNKYNLEINLKIGKYHCWSCGATHNTKGQISKLIREYGNETLLNEYREEVKNIRESQLYDINLFKDDLLEISKDTSVQLPKTAKPINLKTCPYKVKEYLNERRITQDIIDNFKMLYTEWNEKNPLHQARIIIPSYDILGSLNYWVGRDYTKYEKRLKYCNAEDVKKKDIIFNESNINWDGDICLVEGPFDLIPCIPNTIPLLGKSLEKNDLLYQILMNRCKGKIIIYLDGDALDDIKKIYKLLNTGRMYNKIWYVELPRDEDPAHIHQIYGKKGTLKFLKQIKQFKEIDLTF